MSTSTPPQKMADLKVVTPGTDELIDTPHNNDVLCGRGGSINSHAGNERFRELVEKRKRVYLTARFKREKRLIASSIVSEIRSLEPAGRFLSKDAKTGKWKDIGDEKARDKTSQALRENAPKVRAEIETEINKQRAELKHDAMDDVSIAETTAVPPSPYYHPWGGGHYRPIYGYGPPPDMPPPNYPPPGPYQPYDGHYGYGNQPPQQQQQQQQAPSPHGSNHSHHSMQTDESSHQQSNQPSPVNSQQYPGQPSPSNREQAQPSPVPFNHPGEQQNRHPAQQQRQRTDIAGKSTFDGLPSFVSSVPSSIANWTKNSFSFGGGPEEGSRDEHGEQPASEPIAYIHRPESSNKRSQRVTFRDDYQRGSQLYHRSGRRPGVSQFRNGYSSHRPRGPRRTPQRNHPSQRPAKRQQVQQDYTEDDEDNQSLLSQVASHIMGSWETPIPSCTMNGSSDALLAAEPQQDEGQEVELVEMMSFEDPIIEEEDDIREEESQSMQPPQDRRVEIDWPSRIGSCGTWLPEASSFFSVQDNPLSPTTSMDMDQSAAYSCAGSIAGSIGGGSLCQVFANDQIYNGGPPEIDQRAVNATSSWGQHSMMSQVPSWDGSASTPQMEPKSLNQAPSWEPGTNGTPHMDHKTLNQIPSWERSFHNKSPTNSTICSDMESTTDLKSMGSGDMGSRISPVPIGIGSSPRNSISQNMDMFDQSRMRE